MELVSGSYSIGQNLYHLEWCPKYRYNMFKQGENKNLCGEVLYEVAKRHKIEITELYDYLADLVKKNISMFFKNKKL